MSYHLLVMRDHTHLDLQVCVQMAGSDPGDVDVAALNAEVLIPPPRPQFEQDERRA